MSQNMQQYTKIKHITIYYQPMKNGKQFFKRSVTITSTKMKCLAKSLNKSVQDLYAYTYRCTHQLKMLINQTRPK